MPPRLSTSAALALVLGAPAPAAAEVPTFTREIAPLFQAKCEGCHRPDGVAPMPLVTYEDARPWARAIRRRVANREMPPWGIDRSVDHHAYLNDPSLTDDEIARIVRWVEAGAPEGPRADPRARRPDSPDRWTIGEPDLIVATPPARIAGRGADQYVEYVVPTGLTEDRYIRAVETRPSREGRRVVHHAVTFLTDASGNDHARPYVSEYAVGKEADVYPPGAGRLLPAGAHLRFRVHFHAAGREFAGVTSVGFALYPRGYVPAQQVVDLTIGLLALDNDLDIPAHSIRQHSAADVLRRPARILSFQPHMHLRGKAMTLTAIAPDGRREVLGAVGRFDFANQTAYAFRDPPELPAGTILQATATYDNTAANRRNPDPNQWVGFGNRAVDEMLQCHVLLAYVERHAP